MPLFTKTPPRGIDIGRLSMAAHEIGHVLAFRHAELIVYSCVIDLAGQVDGNTLIDDPDSSQHYGYLVGLTAGLAGQILWCETYGQRLPEYVRNGWSASGDRVLYKTHQRQHRDARGLRWGKAQRLARSILRDDAKRFRKLTEQLAVAGELDFT